MLVLIVNSVCIYYFSELCKRGITPYAPTRPVVLSIWITGSHSCRYNVWAYFFFSFFSELCQEGREKEEVKFRREG